MSGEATFHTSFSEPYELRNIRAETTNRREMQRHFARDCNRTRGLEDSKVKFHDTLQPRPLTGRPKWRRANDSYTPNRKFPALPTTAFANCASRERLQITNPCGCARLSALTEGTQFPCDLCVRPLQLLFPKAFLSNSTSFSQSQTSRCVGAISRHIGGVESNYSLWLKNAAASHSQKNAPENFSARVSYCVFRREGM